ncbi:hypothetical protein TRSC58_03379 [Trypanosoma rangeli SC58]|uniref:Uncharacterized protein n=1 Tax=Trypanosoma rangeli SC58 TaxID=429131 RepID=A0A061J3J8_TRYRA|nr:hypothetical protein TRSC58_03379 [Trypanosoma rangeli SC58]
MANHTPWIFIVVAGVPLFMSYTKAMRMDAKETHEIQMRVKYRAEFWAKGNEFVRSHSSNVAKQLLDTADTMIGEECTGSKADAAVNDVRPWWRAWG